MIRYIVAGMALIGIAIFINMVTSPFTSAIDCDMNEDGIVQDDGWEGSCQNNKNVFAFAIALLIVAGVSIIGYGVKQSL